MAVVVGNCQFVFAFSSIEVNPNTWKAQITTTESKNMKIKPKQKNRNNWKLPLKRKIKTHEKQPTQLVLPKKRETKLIENIFFSFLKNKKVRNFIIILLICQFFG